MLALSGLAVAYSGWSYLPDWGWGDGDLSFEPMDDPPGFRRLAAGESTAGFDLFVGLEKRDVAHLADAEAEVRADFRHALYGDPATSSDIVPIAFFSDYYCAPCRIQTRTLTALEARHPDNLKIVWRELPELGEPSILAAKAALAAKRQGAYAAFHERLMKSSFQVTPGYIEMLAESIGVDHARLVSDMQSTEIARELESSAAIARILAFIGTPAIVIGHTVIQGLVDDKTLMKIVALEKERG
ncbi:DsbA family protein [Pikeienuella sp. HZG-20]|uniref:DsbA family protein n=1 Tax=Paludibacillus litoralis TaxID=3133267 RepID=UPI0030ED94A6